MRIATTTTRPRDLVVNLGIIWEPRDTALRRTPSDPASAVFTCQLTIMRRSVCCVHLVTASIGKVQPRAVIRVRSAVVDQYGSVAGYHIVRVASSRSTRSVTYVVMALTWPFLEPDRPSLRCRSMLTAAVTATWTDKGSPTVRGLDPARHPGRPRQLRPTSGWTRNARRRPPSAPPVVLGRRRRNTTPRSLLKIRLGSNLLYRIKTARLRHGYAGPRARATAYGHARTPTNTVRPTKNKINLPNEAATIPSPITLEGGSGDRRRTATRHATEHPPRRSRHRTIYRRLWIPCAARRQP